MKLIYVGYAIDKNLCDSQIGASVAGNNMQLGILDELIDKKDIDLDVITVYPTASYPTVRDIVFRKEYIKVTDKVRSTLIGFINIPFLKEITQAISILTSTKKILNENDNVKILTFNARPSISIPLLILKKIYKFEIICLLADPPVDIQERFGLKKIIMNIFWNIIRKSILYYDKIIALNKEAINIYAPKKPYLIVDGGISINESDYIDLNSEYEKDKKIILFTGALTEYNGIIEMIEAMDLISDEMIELHIYGSGPLEEYVRKKSQLMSNVIYKGVVSNKKIKIIQREATLLINPRRTNDLISKVTFPSKMIEYMLSGTPVLSTKLNGLSDEYLEHIYLINSLEPLELAKTIKDVLEYDSSDRYIKQENARLFILNNKTWNVQVNKIYNFINI